MARLNDPPISALPAAPESLDALKRRFIRQNRELARVNSTQSLRIRNLETEISRLLSENIALRERNIAVEGERERWSWDGGNVFEEEIAHVRREVEGQLGELRRALVGGLERLPERCRGRAKEKGGGRKSAGVAEVVKSPGERDWRNRQTLSGVLRVEADGQDGRLPAILEDKYYPRKTFETAEIRELVDRAAEESLESPDLGPPPVAHFDEVETVAFDAGRETEEEVVAQHVNLETRRKRRTSALLQDLVNQVDEAEEVSEAKTLLKPAAKRKLDVSELEEQTPVQGGDQDDFVFQKASRDPAATSTRFTRPTGRQSLHTSPQKNTQPRKALAPKSTNSPSKRPAIASDKASPIKDIPHIRPEKPLLKVRVKPVRLPQSSKANSSSDPTAALESLASPTSGPATINPKTPAASLAALLSPPSTSISTAPSSKPQARHEAAFTASVEDVLNGSLGRASRRNRPAVSYAEPNLRDKMRRPGKSLVGAVEGLGKHGEIAGNESMRGGSVDGKEHGRSDAKVKEEPVDDEGVEEQAVWKTLPLTNGTKDEVGSPLGGKQQISTARTKAGGDTCIDIGNDVVLEKGLELLSIFDPPNSSPADDKQDVNPSQTRTPREDVHDDVSLKEKPMSVPTRSGRVGTRRHSVQPASNTVPPSTSATTSANAHQLGSNISSSTISRAHPRPSSSASLRPTLEKSLSAEVKRAPSVSVLNRPPSRTENGNDADAGDSTSGGTRVERAGGLGRRRSMMV